MKIMKKTTNNDLLLLVATLFVILKWTCSDTLTPEGYSYVCNTACLIVLFFYAFKLVYLGYFCLCVSVLKSIRRRK